MKTTLPLLLLFVLCSISANAQQYLFGKTVTEENIPAAGITVVNMRTNETVFSDQKGIFMIVAQKGDMIRLVSQRFNRHEFRTVDASFQQPVTVTLIRPDVEIEEVKIAFVPSGKLSKDVRALDTPVKVQRLKSDLDYYVSKPLAVTTPSLSMPQTLQLGPNYNVGQASVLGLLGAVAGLVQKAVTPKVTPPTYYERQEFYADVRRLVDRKFFVENGLDEYQFDQLIAFADQRYNLASKYRKNFNLAAVTSFLRLALKEFELTIPRSSRSSEEMKSEDRA